jgi:hypothetical protein
MISDRLKQIIFHKLYDDLSHVEIIPFNNSIWFVDREEKYWYFELQKDGTLWWRYQFFSDFFILFSLVRDEFQSILAEWVEEVLNSRVYITKVWRGIDSNGMEVVLNSRVDTTLHGAGKEFPMVEEVLNSRVIKTSEHYFKEYEKVEDVLNSRVIKTYKLDIDSFTRVEEVLNSKVNTTHFGASVCVDQVEEVLNCGDTAPTFIKVDSNRPLTGQFDPIVENVLNYKVDTASPTLGERLSVLEGVLNNKEEIVEDIRVRIIR